MAGVNKLRSNSVPVIAARLISTAQAAPALPTLCSNSTRTRLCSTRPLSTPPLPVLAPALAAVPALPVLAPRLPAAPALPTANSGFQTLHLTTSKEVRCRTSFCRAVMPKFTDPILLHTKAGTLKSPPYLQGQKKADCVKSHHLADIITKQFTPFLARQSAKVKKAQGDREMERDINQSSTLVNKSLEDINNAALTYEQIEVPELPGAFCLALDKNYTRIFVYFSRGFEMVYGAEIGKWVLESTTYNIEEYSELEPPDIPSAKDVRHSEYKNWLLTNLHLCWADW
ncbi:hypothetical protein DFP73DRAFT_526127 [Morchella snyderi]|nr:hypothetical protein DFP73DRAFT_526127 [Morchella snyderi]